MKVLFAGPIMWLQNTGLLDKFFLEALSPPHEKPLKKIRMNEPLVIQQIATAAIVMLAGLSLASLVFLGERFWAIGQSKL